MAVAKRFEQREYKIVQVRFRGGVSGPYYYLAPSTWNIQVGDRAYRTSMMDEWGIVYRIGLRTGDEIPRYSLKVLDRFEHPEPPKPEPSPVVSLDRTGPEDKIRLFIPSNYADKPVEIVVQAKD